MDLDPLQNNLLKRGYYCNNFKSNGHLTDHVPTSSSLLESCLLATMVRSGLDFISNVGEVGVDSVTVEVAPRSVSMLATRMLGHALSPEKKSVSVSVRTTEEKRNFSTSIMQRHILVTYHAADKMVP